MLTIAKSILFPKSTTIDPFLFLVSAPYLSIISLSLMFPSPTCPLRSAPRTILSSFDTLSINPSRSSQKSFFSSMLLLSCGAYALDEPFYLRLHSHYSLSDTLFISRTLLVSSSLTTIPIPFYSINSAVK